MEASGILMTRAIKMYSAFSGPGRVLPSWLFEWRFRERNRKKCMGILRKYAKNMGLILLSAVMLHYLQIKNLRMYLISVMFFSAGRTV